jgi:hypothetical protein
LELQNAILSRVVKAKCAENAIRICDRENGGVWIKTKKKKKKKKERKKKEKGNKEKKGSNKESDYVNEIYLWVSIGYLKKKNALILHAANAVLSVNTISCGSWHNST